jgi:hypothetical protein
MATPLRAATSTDLIEKFLMGDRQDTPRIHFFLPAENFGIVRTIWRRGQLLDQVCEQPLLLLGREFRRLFLDFKKRGHEWIIP